MAVGEDRVVRPELDLDPAKDEARRPAQRVDELLEGVEVRVESPSRRLPRRPDLGVSSAALAARPGTRLIGV